MTEFDLDVRVSHYEMGSEVFTQVILRDITASNLAKKELIQAKNRAEELSNQKTNFLANMNHEFRTPLNGILGFSELLSERLVEPDLNAMARGIHDSGIRLNKTLELILMLSEIEAETLPVFSKKVNIVDHVKAGIAQFADEISRKGLKLDLDLKYQKIIVNLDEHLFRRAFNCLLDNALKFTDKGGIRVESGTTNNSIQPFMYLRVEDTGIGISEGETGLIWQEFRQVSEGRSRLYQGTGLGLTITKRAVELMGGEVTVKSRPGTGSVFTLKFPLAGTVEESCIMDNDANGKPGTMGRIPEPQAMPLVLYVEDDPMNREIMSIFLKNTCKVETAGDAETALEMVRGKHYDLVLMDINLGSGRDGLDVVKNLLRIPGYQGVKIVAVTAYSTSNDKAEFLQGGCTHYISKPFGKKDVISLVGSILHSANNLQV